MSSAGLAERESLAAAFAAEIVKANVGSVVGRGQGDGAAQLLQARGVQETLEHTELYCFAVELERFIKPCARFVVGDVVDYDDEA